MRHRPSLLLSLATAGTLVIACAPDTPPRAAAPLAPAASASSPLAPPLPPGTKQCDGSTWLKDSEASFAESAKQRPPGASQDSSMSDHVVAAKDACGVADANLSADADRVLERTHAPAPPVARATWDKRSPPRYLDRVERRFPLSAAERARLFANGFVVPERDELSSYGFAFHEIFQSELPVYVSMDALFHAIYVVNDSLIEQVEAQRLAPMLHEVLASLTCALPGAAADYPPEVARDLDVYLTVAKRLLLDQDDAPTVFDTADQVAGLVEAAKAASGLAELTLFGRRRMVDFSAYRPRGHYAKEGAFLGGPGSMASYFRASTWLSRLELNLVSRSSRSSEPGASPNPEETPREATVALALADLAERAGVMDRIGTLDLAWSLFAGKREDVSLADLATLRRKARVASLTDPRAPALLRAAIGDDFQRTARIHYMPQGSAVLPAIATMLGPRIPPDTTATRPLVHDEVNGRYLLGAADMAYALGNDRAKRYLAQDLATFPSLAAQLAVARAIVQKPLPTSDLYSSWFAAVRAVAQEKPSGALPSYMETEAFLDLRLNTVVAGFAQIRHNYVLMAGQGYDSYGCEIPDGFVEPAPRALDALIAYTDRGRAAMARLDPMDMTDAQAYFARVGKILRVLREIVEDELRGRPLTTEEKRFLGMVAEYVPNHCEGSSCLPPTYTGWWFDLFIRRIRDGLLTGELIADYYTSTNLGKVAYVGAKKPRLGVFIVDTGGGPRAFVGPVAHAYATTSTIEKRLTDDDAQTITQVDEPWAASYTAKAPVEPPLVVTGPHLSPPHPALAHLIPLLAPGRRPPNPPTSIVLEATSTRALGPVTLELLDHHRAPLGRLTQNVGTATTAFRFVPALFAGKKLPETFEGIRVKIGDFEHVWARSLIEGGETEVRLGEMRVAKPAP